MTVLFRQMTICGVGLIGGSLALTARKHGLVERIVGLGRTQSNLDVALARGLIDVATRDPAEAARGADLVMLATPVMTFPETLAAMIPHLPEDAVITDVGSVKAWVVTQAGAAARTADGAGRSPSGGRQGDRRRGARPRSSYSSSGA